MIADHEDISRAVSCVHVSLEEQETVIRFGRNGDIVNVWTSDSTMMTKLDKMVRRSSNYKLKRVTQFMGKGKIASKEYEIEGKKLVSFRSDKTKRTMTDEQKRLHVEKLRAFRMGNKPEAEEHGHEGGDQDT